MAQDCCPMYDNPDFLCNIEARYDRQPLSQEALATLMGALPAAILSSVHAQSSADAIATILEAASGQTYRGSVCVACGAFFPPE